jgi:hypothetical protein
MLRRLIHVASLLVVTVVAAPVTGCGDGDNSAAPTLLPTGTMGEAATATMPPGTSIRDEDLSQQPGLRDFLSTAGGSVDPNVIIYDDITQDGIEDAVVPVSSGGEGGNIALFAYAFQDGAVEQILRVTTATSLTAGVVAGTLQVTEAAFVPGDPMCCPSELRTTTYEWNGEELVAAGETTGPRVD